MADEETWTDTSWIALAAATRNVIAYLAMRPRVVDCDKATGLANDAITAREETICGSTSSDDGR